MPSERFMRLPDKKRQIIRDAAMKEFARVPFEKVSINQMIHTAGISRGSFYTYFEDKQDVVDFLFAEIGNEIDGFVEQELKKNGGDFFVLLRELFEYMVERLHRDGELIRVVRNIFSYQENLRSIGMRGMEDREGERLQWMYDRIDVSRLRLKSREEFAPLMGLGMMLLLVSIKRYYEFPDQLDYVRETLMRSLELLKHGALKPASRQEEKSP